MEKTTTKYDGSQGVAIIFIDGGKEWIDPILEISETDDKICFVNGYYEYEYEKSKLSQWEFYNSETSK